MDHSAHIKPLDGLRGVAILLVVVPHLAFAGMLPGPDWVQHALATVAHGVDIFFVLSGFGLAYPLIAERLAGRSGRLDLLTYAFNRLYRLLPPFYLAVAAGLAAAIVVKSAGHFPTGDMLIVPHSIYEALAPLLLFDRANLPVNPNLWTIAVQFRWYALFPILLLIWMKAPRAFALLLCGAWVGYLMTRDRSIDLGTLPLFMLGIVAAELIARGHRAIGYVVAALPLAILAAVAWDPYALVPDPWSIDSHFLGQPTSMPWQLAAFALVLAAATVPPVRALLSWPPLTALGTASFSIYLMHEPVIALVLAMFGPHSGLLAAAALFAAGFGFWWCVERPLTHGASRRKLRERARPVMARTFAFLGLPQVLRLSELHVVAAEERVCQLPDEPRHESANGAVDSGIRLGDERDERGVAQIGA
jgi:peptidoglycan/LPS O-acetylase OafA/YrhL